MSSIIRSLATMLRRPSRGLVGAALLLLFATGSAHAQEADPMGFGGLGRPYWHVFAAYALALLLIGGWVVSIARRLGRIERRLDDPGR